MKTRLILAKESLNETEENWALCALHRLVLCVVLCLTSDWRIIKQMTDESLIFKEERTLTGSKLAS